MSKPELRIFIDNDESEECPICMEQIGEGQKCITNICRHRFCYTCLTRWSNEHNYCPKCRQIFSVFIFVNHLRHKNDFQLIVVENGETVHRKAIELRRKTLRQRLVKEMRRRKQLIDDLKQRIQFEEEIVIDIQRNITKIDANQNESNRFLEQILNEVITDTDIYIIDMSDTETDDMSRRSQLSSLSQISDRSEMSADRENDEIEWHLYSSYSSSESSPSDSLLLALSSSPGDSEE